ncbi:hypothetical protein HAALTHF_24950n [Vreelandella aquamarina]|nr:hypothetical protein HAALTHF_24950n [Halomonas axialensis]
MSLNSIREVNFDGLVGLTHNYSGLAHGNVASMSHGGLVSNPKEGGAAGAGQDEVADGRGLCPRRAASSAAA